MATRQGVKNITWKHGRLERVPLHDASVDVVLLSQALHHAAEPARALAESARVLRPDGRVLILDLRTHEEAWVRAKLGDRWLGFDDDALRRLVAGAGLVEATVRIGTRRASDPFTVLVATGRKPRQGRSGRTTA
jgi:ArsR family transcriptional regulator